MKKLEKQIKITYWLLITGIGGSVIHNLIYALFSFEEPVFFFISVLGLLAFLVSIPFNLVTYKLKGRPKDLWQLGWIGLLGLVGFIPQFGSGFYGLYGFFGFFGFKKK